MKFIDLKCNHCGANLNIDPDNIQAFCQYCGNKLLIDMDKLSEVLKEKEKTKQVIEKEQHITKRKELDYNYKKEKDKSDLKTFLVISAVLFMTILLIDLHDMIKDYMSYICIGLGIAIGLIAGYVIYKKIIKKK